MRFFTHDVDVNIVNSGDCQPESLESYQVGGLIAREGDASPLTQYFDVSTGQIVDFDQATIDRRRSPPNVGFRWNRGQWIDQRSLAEAKTQKWREIKRARDAVEFGTFMVGAYEFDCDQRSQARIMTAMQAATDARSLGEPFGINWTLTDGTELVLTRTQAIAVGRALQVHVNAQFEKARTLKASIAAATTMEEVIAVAW